MMVVENLRRRYVMTNVVGRGSVKWEGYQR